MKRVCATGSLTRVIDIYHGDYIEDINKVLETGVDGIYLKAWENQVDPSFLSRWHALKGKVIRGAYDFFHPEHDAILQAHSFCSLIPDLADDDFPPLLDWETSGGTLSQADREAGYQWLVTVRAITKRRPTIYGSPAFLQALRLDKRFLAFDLYVANYGTKCPVVPDPWTNWTLWQTNEAGHIDGMRGNVDLDVYNGDLNAMKAWIATTKIS